MLIAPWKKQSTVSLSCLRTDWKLRTNRPGRHLISGRYFRRPDDSRNRAHTSLLPSTRFPDLLSTNRQRGLREEMQCAGCNFSAATDEEPANAIFFAASKLPLLRIFARRKTEWWRRGRSGQHWGNTPVVFSYLRFQPRMGKEVRIPKNVSGPSRFETEIEYIERILSKEITRINNLSRWHGELTADQNFWA